MLQEQEISKTVVTWKKITSPTHRVPDSGNFICKDDYICKIKFENDIPVLKIKDTLIVNSRGRLQYIYEGTFNEKYELHGENCKLTEQYIKDDGLVNKEHTDIYSGTFENGVLKWGTIKHGRVLYKEGTFTGDMDHLRLVSGTKYLDDIVYTGDFYYDGGILQNTLKKGKQYKNGLHKDFLYEGEFSPKGCLTNGKITMLNYDRVRIKEGIFDSDGENLLQGKQILHNKVIMEGTFKGEQLRNGKVIYPGDDCGDSSGSDKKGTTIEGDFTNALFDCNGTIHRNSKYLKDFNNSRYGVTLNMVPTRHQRANYCCTIA